VFIQNKVNLIFNSKLYQVPMITESWVTQNRVNSNSPEYSDPVPRLVAHVLKAASAEQLITTVIMSGVSSLPSHMISYPSPHEQKYTYFLCWFTLFWTLVPILY